MFYLAIRSHEYTHLANKVIDSEVWCSPWNLFSCSFDGKWIPVQLLPAVLTCLSCPVLFCPSFPWLPWPTWDSHTETNHTDVLLTDRGRCLLLCFSLCVPLSPAQPGFGSVNPLLFSPPLSVTAPGAAPLLFIHPKHCWGTPAWVLMQRSGHSSWHQFLLPPSPTALLTFCLAWLLPPSKLLYNFPCDVWCPVCCPPAVSL